MSKKKKNSNAKSKLKKTLSCSEAVLTRNIKKKNTKIKKGTEVKIIRQRVPNSGPPMATVSAGSKIFDVPVTSLKCV